jgi:DNA polymerase-3 subunit beta
MKIVCPKADLSRIISLAQSAASTKNVMPVLTNLLFEADKDSLTVTGTDLELGVRIKINLEVAQPGTATLPAKKLSELVKTFDDGDVEISVKDGVKGEIKSGRATIKLQGVPADDYPNFPGYRKEKSLTLPSKVLLDMITSNTSWPRARNPSRPWCRARPSTNLAASWSPRTIP